MNQTNRAGMNGAAADAPASSTGAANAAAPGPPHPHEVVTQADLLEFTRLTALTRSREALRKRLLAQLDAGVPVEPGPLTAAVTRRAVRVLTRSTLAAVVGPGVVAAFLEAIDPTERRRLDVREAGPPTAPAPGRTVRRPGARFGRLPF